MHIFVESIQFMAETVDKEIKQTTLYLDPKLILLMKAVAAREDKAIGEIWNEAATKFLIEKGEITSAEEVVA